MALPQEVVAPITTDLRAEELNFDIVKGIEHVNYIDGKLDAGDVEEGDWVQKTATGFAVPPAGSVKCYPVVTGNNRYDALATGQVTVIIGGNWIYKTKKYVAGSYTVGQLLTVKNSQTLPGPWTSGDIACGRVYSIDAVNNVMEILVLNS